MIRTLIISLVFCAAAVYAVTPAAEKTILSDSTAKIQEDTSAAKNNISLELQKIFAFAVKENLSSQPISEVVTAIGKYFIGTEYVGSTLDANSEEKLVINFKGLDCTTLVENVLAIARTVKSDSVTEEHFKKELTLIRYRDGILNHYPSRLHYFSDWIYDNSKKNIITDITKEIGGKELKLNLNLMSSHPDFYFRLRNNPEFVPVIKEQEQAINKREYYFIPKEQIDRFNDTLNNGDIIAFTTSRTGLDITHVGIAVKEADGKVYLLNASTEYAKVVISKKTISEYARDIKKITGIMVLRPLESKR